VDALWYAILSGLGVVALAWLGGMYRHDDRDDRF
jgi:hypothetical protein